MKALDGATAKEIIVKKRGIFICKSIYFLNVNQIILTSARFTRIVPCWPGSRFSKASEK